MACGTGCSTGCARLSITYDWLENMLPPGSIEGENIYEIRFKSTRKGFFRNIHTLPVVTGDFVVVESERGFDIGIISMGGELARLQMKKKKIDERFVSNILRFANEHDLLKLEKLREQENEILVKTRAIIQTLNIEMKLSDIEFQGDGSKAVFYYTADQRVDFRELIRILASEFKTRIEMKQIGLRQESGMLGGLGSCGRELCCSTWLTDFKSVNTSAARYQNISLNPSKITGQCGRLKCCLNFELETYLDALKNFPDVKEIQTELGTAHLQKTDIFKRILWYSYGGDANWTCLTAEQVLELNNLNKRGVLPPALAAFEEKSVSEKSRLARPSKKNGEPVEYLSDFVDVVGQSNLHERMTKKSSGNKKRRIDPISSTGKIKLRKTEKTQNSGNKSETNTDSNVNSNVKSNPPATFNRPFVKQPGKRKENKTPHHKGNIKNKQKDNNKDNLKPPTKDS